MQMTPSFIRIQQGVLTVGDQPSSISAAAGPEALYHSLQAAYPKFFKMDVLSKSAWLGAEALLKEASGMRYEGLDKNRIAVVLSTADGSLQVDKRYAESLNTIPSPALFVYTLPNIMLGEICIRHGFKGEQLCLVQSRFDAEELCFRVQDLLNNRGMEACLMGWVDALEDHMDVCLFWVRSGQGDLDAGWMQRIYESGTA